MERWIPYKGKMVTFKILKPDSYKLHENYFKTNKVYINVNLLKQILIPCYYVHRMRQDYQLKHYHSYINDEF